MNNDEAYLNLGCLLMASSGKNSDLDTPFSTGVGAYSGLVKPGQPNLHKGGENKVETMFQRFLHDQICCQLISDQCNDQTLKSTLWLLCIKQLAAFWFYFVLISTEKH